MKRFYSNSTVIEHQPYFYSCSIFTALPSRKADGN